MAHAQTGFVALQHLLGDAELEIVIEPDLAAARANLDDFDLEGAMELFSDVAGFGCPDWLQPYLSLPDRLQWSLRLGNNAWEAGIVHPLLFLDRSMDAVYAQSLAGLGDPGGLLILDQTVNVTAAAMVLVKRSDLTRPELFYFDTREFSPLTITAAEYLDLVIGCCGVDGWQLAYSRLAITHDRKARLKRSADWLDNSNSEPAARIAAAIREKAS